MRSSQALANLGTWAIRILGEGIGGIFLVLMMGLTSVDVLLRLIFNYAIFGATETIQIFMIGAGFFGLAATAIAEKHARADILVRKFPKRGIAAFDIFNGLCVLFVAVVLVMGNIREMRSGLQLESVTLLLQWPQWPLYAVIAFCYLLLGVAMVSLISRYSRHLRGDE